MYIIMLALFIEDLELYLQDGFNSGIKIDDVLIVLLLCADDMIIFGNSPTD